MTEHNLTKNQQLVFSTLSKEEGPLTAYTILDRLRGSGFRAPLQVYRALDKLREFGLVHKLESLNAFVACSHPDCQTHTNTAFAICDKCGNVLEFSSDNVEKTLGDWASKNNFEMTQTTIELRGFCTNCAAS